MDKNEHDNVVQENPSCTLEQIPARLGQGARESAPFLFNFLPYKSQLSLKP